MPLLCHHRLYPSETINPIKRSFISCLGHSLIIAIEKQLRQHLYTYCTCKEYKALDNLYLVHVHGWFDLSNVEGCNHSRWTNKWVCLCSSSKYHKFSVCFTREHPLFQVLPLALCAALVGHTGQGTDKTNTTL